MIRTLTACLIAAAAGTVSAVSQVPGQAATPAAPAAARPARPPAPTREPHTKGYVAAKDLPDGTIPSPREDGILSLAQPIPRPRK